MTRFSVPWLNKGFPKKDAPCDRADEGRSGGACIPAALPARAAEPGAGEGAAFDAPGAAAARRFFLFFYPSFTHPYLDDMALVGWIFFSFLFLYLRRCLFECCIIHWLSRRLGQWLRCSAAEHEVMGSILGRRGLFTTAAAKKKERTH